MLIYIRILIRIGLNNDSRDESNGWIQGVELGDRLRQAFISVRPYAHKLFVIGASLLFVGHHHSTHALSFLPPPSSSSMPGVDAFSTQQQHQLGGRILRSNNLMYRKIHIQMHFLSNLVAFSLSTSSQNLSWQELGELLLDVKSQGVPDDVILNTRFPSLQLSRVKVGPSMFGQGQAGRGVFATVDCQQGDLLTCYPGDVLLTKYGFTPDPKEKGIANDEMLRDLLSRYCIGVTEDTAIMALPELDSDMAYAGQFINDGIGKPPETKEDLEMYVEESQSKANAEFLPLENLHMVAIATRDIEKGEEICVHYGPVYWYEHTATWKGGELFFY